MTAATDPVPEWRTPKTCWTPQAAMALPVEAEEMSVAQFLQTHVRLDLSRVNPVTLEQVEGDLTEHDVLEMLRRLLEVDERATNIIPILGKSGAGKSHLVRWLRHSLVDATSDDLRVVFIPKHKTSLRGVVERVLSAFDDVHELDDVRESLLSASDRSESELELRSKLRSAIANGLEFHGETTDVPPELEEQRAALMRYLPPLFHDGHFGPRYVADGSAIARLVQEKLTGRAGSDAAETAFRFSEADVMVEADDIGNASADAKMAVQMLLQNPEAGGRRLTDLAVEMINDQLPRAVREVFGVGGSDLRDLFIRAREILHGRQDILLLVEDFAMFQGLQDGLIDAITVMVSSDEGAQLCALITVFAVTSGYYSGSIPETLKTRSTQAFDVGEQHDDAPERFASSYLRAIRLGEDEIAVRHERNQRGTSSCDGCEVLELCHEGFGSVDGEGLFPFNATMLRRASQATMPDGFNARRFLNQVLRPVLIEDHAAFTDGTFPTARVAERFSLSRYEPAGDALIAARRAPDGEQRARAALLLKDPVDSGDMPTAIHSALGLDPLGLVGGAKTAAPSQKTPAGEQQRSKEARGPEVPPLVAAVDRWQQTGKLSQSDRRTVRELVTTAVLNRISFNDGGWRPSAWTSAPGPFFDGQSRSIVLDDDGNAPTGAVELHLSWQSPEHADAVQTLAWLDATGTVRLIPNGAARVGRLETILTGWVETVVEQLRLHVPDPADLARTVAALELLHALRGVTKQGVQDRTELLVGDLPAEHQLSKLQVQAHEVLVTRFRRSVGYARGDRGSVTAVDVGLVRGALRASQHVNLLEDVGAPPRQVRSLSDALAVVADACRREGSDPDVVARDLPDTTTVSGDDPVALAAEIRRVCSGHVAEPDLDQLESAATEIRPRDTAAVERAASALAEWDDLNLRDRVALVNGSWRGPAERLGRFVDLAERSLADATPGGTVLGEGERSTVEASWRRALVEAEAAIASLKEVVQ